MRVVLSSWVAGPARPPPGRVEAFLLAPPELVQASCPAGRSCVAELIGYQFSVGTLDRLLRLERIEVDQRTNRERQVRARDRVANGVDVVAERIRDAGPARLTPAREAAVLIGAVRRLGRHLVTSH